MDCGDRVDAAPLQVVVPSQAVVPSKATMTLATMTLVVWSRAPPAIPVMSEGVRRCSAQKLNTTTVQNVKTRNTGAAGLKRDTRVL